MTGAATSGHALRGKALTAGMLLFVSLGMSALAVFPAVSAQTPQYIVATPNYINLGMNTTIAATGPAIGAYQLVVQAPSGTQYLMVLNFNAAGQTYSEIFGNSTVGFNQVVTQAGTYSVFLQQAGTVVSSTTFLVTSQVKISFDMIMAGACVFVPGGSRGQEMLAQFHITYASNGMTVENAATWVSKAFTTHGATVTYTLPDGSVATASLHASTATTWPQPWYQGHVWPTWNTSWVGNYAPTVKASDQYGNVGTYTYSGYPYPIAPATFTTTISLADAKTGAAVTGLYNGQNATVTANILYTNPLPVADTVAGFAGPLDLATRGGVVTAVVGWGPYNATSGGFGTAKLPGGLIATVPMTYSTTTKVWTGPLSIGTLPTLLNATSYSVVVSSHDKAQPPNTGFATLSLPPATLVPTTGPATTTATITTTSLSTTTTTVSGAGATSTATITSTAPASTITSTVPGATSTATSISVVTSTHTAVSTSVQSSTVIPWWAYVLVVAFLVELGIPIGYTMRSASGRKQAPPK